MIDQGDRRRGVWLCGAGRAEVRVGAILRPRCGIASAHRTFGPTFGELRTGSNASPPSLPGCRFGGNDIHEVAGPRGVVGRDWGSAAAVTLRRLRPTSASVRDAASAAMAACLSEPTR